MSNTPKPPLNPFHFLLGLVGLVFLVTAVGYTVLLVREGNQTWTMPHANQTLSNSDQQLSQMEFQRTNQEHPFLLLLKEHGLTIIMTEIILLALFSFGAIALDRYRDTRTVKVGSHDATQTISDTAE